MSRAVLRGIYLLVTAVVIAFDRITKVLVARNIELNFGSIQVVPNFFSITHVENTGAAFSLFAEWPMHYRVPILVGFSATAMVVVAIMLWKSGDRFNATGVALACILGGAIGNLWDRILYGRVTDFLHVYVRNYSWPDFNIADSAIVCGAALLIWELTFGHDREASRARSLGRS